MLKVSPERQHLEQLRSQDSSRSSYKIENFNRARAFQEYLVSRPGANVVENGSVEAAVNAIIGLCRDFNLRHSK
ncbi:MAG: hypothetical protein ABH879_02715 [archaeon]